MLENKSKENKKLRKWFLYIFIIGLVIVNWEAITLVTDYRFLQGKMYVFAESRGWVASIGQNLNPKNFVSINKIGVKAPIVLPQTSQTKDLDKALKRGVAHYPLSDFPGEQGTAVLLGHSAPDYWPAVNYDWVFSDLDKLEQGDNIIVKFDEVKYFYKVKSKVFLDKGEELSPLDNIKPSIVLISCWPPGKNYKRIVIEAELR